MEASEKDFFIISHRGASAYLPENTLSSFRKAIELGADLIELDVRKTKDDKLVVIHDSKVDRTTNGFGRVIEKTQEELRQYDAGSGEKIPLLEEVLALDNGDIGFVIELKEERTEDEVIETMKDLRSVDVDFLTIGQYMRPTLKHLPVKEYVDQSIFDEYGNIARELNFQYVASAPLVRSSYRAGELFIGKMIDDTNTH